MSTTTNNETFAALINDFDASRKPTKAAVKFHKTRHASFSGRSAHQGRGNAVNATRTAKASIAAALITIVACVAIALI